MSAPKSGRSVAAFDQSQNGVRVIVHRVEGGTYVEADCQCFGVTFRVHSDPNCPVRLRALERKDHAMPAKRRIMSLAEALHRGRFLVNVAVGEGAIPDEDEGERILRDIAIAALEQARHKALDAKITGQSGEWVEGQIALLMGTVES